ncbi:hypothetical protein RI367_004746 [Sorochytrium milnesiophthora]
MAHTSTPGDSRDDATLIYTLRAVFAADMLLDDARRNGADISSAGGDALAPYVRKTFGLSEKTYDATVKTVRHKLEMKHFCRDLKRYLDMIEKNVTPNHTPRDFDSPAAYEAWKVAEKRESIQLMTRLLHEHPKVTLQSRHAKKQPTLGEPLLFVPSDASACYRAVLDRCRAVDEQAAGAAVTELSSASNRLLECVAQRWRVAAIFRKTLLLELLLNHALATHESTVQGLVSRLDEMRAMDQSLFTALTTTERSCLLGLLHRIRDDTLARLKSLGMNESAHSGLAKQLEQSLTLLYSVSQLAAKTSGSLASSMSVTAEQAKHLVKNACIKLYVRLSSSSPSVKSSMDTPARIFALAEQIEAETQSFLKLAKSPSLSPSLPTPSPSYTSLASSSGSVSSNISSTAEFANWMPLYVIGAQYLVEFFFAEVDELWSTHAPDSAKDQTINVVFHCYDRLCRMQDLYREVLALAANAAGKSIGPAPARMVRYEAWFNDCVDNWIEKTSENMTEIWTTRAMAEDKFQPTDDASHSTSVIDLCTAFHQGIEALTSLPWPSYDHQYRAVKRFTKMICNTCTAYGNHMQSNLITALLQLDQPNQLESPAMDASNSPSLSKSFVDRLRKSWSEMSHGSSNGDETSSSTSPSSLMSHSPGSTVGSSVSSRVAQQVISKIRVPVTFHPHMCVRLNNIFAMQERIDGVYDCVARVVAPPSDDYASPFPGQETLVRLTMSEFRVPTSTSQLSAYAHPSTPGAAPPETPLYYAEVMYDGKLLGRIPLTITKDLAAPTAILRAQSSGSIVGSAAAAAAQDDAQSIFVPLLSVMPLQVFVYQALASSVTVFGSATVTLDTKEMTDTADAVQWLALDGERGRLRLSYARAESEYVYYWFSDIYEWLGTTTDNVLLMFVDQITSFIKAYLLQAIKRHKEGPVVRRRSFLGTQLLAPKPEPTFESVEQDIKPLLDYLNQNLETLNTYLDERISGRFFRRLWKQFLNAVETLAVSRVNKSGSWKRLKTRQVEVLDRALQLVKDFFHAEGEGIPLRQLETTYYFKVAALLKMYLLPTEALIQKYLFALNEYLAYKIEKLNRKNNVRALFTLSRSSSQQSIQRSPMSNNGSPIGRALPVNTEPLGMMSPPIGHADGFASLMRAHSKRHTLSRQRSGYDESPLVNAGGLRQRRPLTDGKKKPKFHFSDHADFDDDDDDEDDEEGYLASANGGQHQQAAARASNAIQHGLGLAINSLEAMSPTPVRRSVDGRVPPQLATPALSSASSDLPGSPPRRPSFSALLPSKKATSMLSPAPSSHSSDSSRGNTLASQEAVWTLLTLRSDSEKECREFVRQQEDTLKVIIRNLEREASRSQAAAAHKQQPLSPLAGRVKDSAYF